MDLVTLKIIQWNIHSVNANRNNLLHFIRVHNPDVIILNETWLNATYNLHVKSYNIIRLDRRDGWGGIATLIKSNIKFKEVKLDPTWQSFDCQFMVIKINSINIINMYGTSRNKISPSLFSNIFQSLEGYVIIMGDLNAHHPSWGSVVSNPSGSKLIDIMENHKLVILNDGRATRFHNPNENPSPVDLTLISDDIASHATWQVLPDCGNSDHFPTTCTINLQETGELYLANHNLTRRILRKANWDMYSENIGFSIDADITYEYDTLLNIINVAADIAIPSTKSGVLVKPRCPWWDLECDQKILLRKQAVQSFSSNPSLENYVNAKKTIAMTRKFLKSKKKTKFKTFCSTLNRNSSASYVWKTVKKFSNSNSKSLNKNFPERNMAELILTGLSSCNIEPDFTLQQVDHNTPPFSMVELKTCLIDKRDTAPGIDKVSYSMLRNLPNNAVDKLLQIYNRVLFGEHIPAIWKESIILGFLKPGRDADCAANYRAIALTSCALKILEQMIKNRLDWTVESRKLLPDCQTGFRKGIGTSENVAYLVSYVQLSLSQNKKVIAVFLDIKAAYDNVNIYKLYKYLIRYEFQPDICNLIYRLLENRVIYVKDNEGMLQGPKSATKGIAQGSPMSPLLFNIYLKSLFQIIPNDMILLSYADDLVLLSEGNDVNHMIQKINETLEDISQWLNMHNFTLSINKCEAVMFNKGRFKQNLPPIRVMEEIIDYKRQIKYLGITITYNLNWDIHVTNMCGNALKGINVLRSFCRVWWGSDPVTLLMAYNGIVKSHLDYGSIFIRPSSKAVLNKLNSVHNASLRLITGCMKTTPTNVLLAETSETTLENRRRWLAVKFLTKIIGFIDHPLLRILNSLKIYCQSKEGYWHNKNVPYLIEALSSISTYLPYIYRSNIMPCYQFNQEDQISPIQTINLNLNKGDIATRQKFLNSIEQYQITHTIVYTDASRDNNKAGFGVYIPEIDYSFSSKLPNITNICTAETIAINKGIETCLEYNLSNIIILTDSKSALMKLNKCKVDAKNDYVCLQTKQLILESKRNNINVKLAWVPGHSAINGNEKADALAKIGKNLNVPLDLKLDKSEILPNCKTQIKQEFFQEWKDTFMTKGRWYYNIQNTFPQEPWYTKFPFMDRRHITTIIRMRTGHCLTKSHLYRMGLKEDAYCECGQIEDLNHIFFECPINQIPNFNIYNEIIRTNIPAPFDISIILGNLNLQTIKILIKFLTYNKIHL